MSTLKVYSATNVKNSTFVCNVLYTQMICDPREDTIVSKITILMARTTTSLQTITHTQNRLIKSTLERRCDMNIEPTNRY